MALPLLRQMYLVTLTMKKITNLRTLDMYLRTDYSQTLQDYSKLIRILYICSYNNNYYYYLYS